MTVQVIAQTTTSGPVVIGSYETAAAAQAAYRREQRVLRDGGYAEDVTAIELRSGDPGHANPETSKPEEMHSETGKD